MAIRLRDISPAIFLHPMAIGHSNAPLAHLDIRHDANENKLITSFLNPLGTTDGITTSARLGKDVNSNESIKFNYVYKTTAADRYFRLNHEGDASPLGLFLRSGGYVGVGVANPSHKLEVLGEAVFSNETHGTKFSWSTGNAAGVIDTYGNHNLELRTNGAQKMMLNSHGVGIAGGAAASDQQLRVHGNIALTGALIQGANTQAEVTVITTDGYVQWGRISGEPGWLATNQNDVTVDGFKDNLSWNKVGTTASPVPSWIESSQSTIDLSGFNNDLGASSQWADVVSAIGQTNYSGIYYTGSSLTGKVSIGQNAVAAERLMVRDDATWQLVLKNGATDGGSWFWGVNATNVLRGDKGKLLLSTSLDPAHTKFTFCDNGRFMVNTDPATTDGNITNAEKFVVTGDSYFKGTTYNYHTSDQNVTMNSGYNSGGKTGDHWSTWWYNYMTGAADKNIYWYQNGTDYFVMTDGGQLGVNKSSITSGFHLDVAGDLRCKSVTEYSDENMKENVSESDLGLAFINKLNPIKFKWKNYTEERTSHRNNLKTSTDYQFSRTHYGLMAQQVKATVDELGIEDFGGYKDSTVKEPNKPAEYGLDYKQLISPLVKAIQELTLKVEALENVENA